MKAVRASAVFSWATVLSFGSAHALTPTEVFESVSPSVWLVGALDAEKRRLGFGSGVVIAARTMVTNCHVLVKAKAIEVRREQVRHTATLAHADAERDLCILSVPDLAAPAVEIAPLSSVRIGNRAYVVGNPEGFELTLSEGLISGLRSMDASRPPIQTTAPISQGSSGGGLFDERGRLVGIMTLIHVGRLRIAQNLNFAAPAEWIAEVPERAKEQLSRLSERRAAGTARPTHVHGAPLGAIPVGSKWTYSYREQLYGLEQVFTVRVTGVNGSTIDESITDERGTTDLKSFVDTRNRDFAQRKIPGRSILELSPYQSSAEPAAEFAIPGSYPGLGAGDPFRVRVETMEREDVQVPAGSFKALRVDVSGDRHVSRGRRAIVRFRYTAWYAPGIRRYVKARHQQWDRAGALTTDEVLQLLEYRSEATPP